MEVKLRFEGRENLDIKERKEAKRKGQMTNVMNVMIIFRAISETYKRDSPFLCQSTPK